MMTNYQDLCEREGRIYPLQTKGNIMTTTKNGTDVAALREEVAALRVELAQLRVDLAGEVRTRSLVVVDEHGAERITTTIDERHTALMISSGDLPDRARFGCPNETGHFAPVALACRA